MSLESRKGEGRKGWVALSLVLLLYLFLLEHFHTVLFSVPNSLHISPGRGAVCFITLSLEIVGSYWLDEWLEG